MAAGQWTIKDIVLAVLSACALIVALTSYLTNYRLAKRVADRPGRLHRVSLTSREPQDGGGFDLVLGNGPAPLTIVELYLTVRFQLPRTNFFASHRVVFPVRPADFPRLGITGPALPCRVEAHDQVTWHLPSTGGLPENCNVEYQWHGRTALDDRFDSRVLTLGWVEGFHWFGSEDMYQESLSGDADRLAQRYPLVGELIDRHRAGELHQTS